MKKSIPVLDNIPQSGGVEISPQVALLADTLLRRGFPVRVEPRGLALCLSINRWDVAYMRDLLAPLNFFADAMKGIGPRPDERVGWSAAKEVEAQDGWLSIWGGKRLVMQVDLSDEQSLAALRSQILRRRSCRYEAGCSTMPDDYRTWKGFLSNRFGAKLSTKELEQGMALLVKVLPWVGVRTSMSCHGHGLKGNPKIRFYGYYHSRWCEVIFERLFADLEIAKMWRFRHGSRNGDWASGKWEIYIPQARQLLDLENPDDEEIIYAYRSMEEAFAKVDEQIQIMARRLFDPVLCAEIREVRQQAEGVKDLAAVLEKALSD